LSHVTEQLERDRRAEEDAIRERDRLQRLKDEERRRKEQVQDHLHISNYNYKYM